MGLRTAWRKPSTSWVSSWNRAKCRLRQWWWIRLPRHRRPTRAVSPSAESVTLNTMERTVQRFPDFQSADRATLQYYRSLTPAQRIEILLELIERAQESDDATRQGLARVYRILKLPRR